MSSSCLRRRFFCLTSFNAIFLVVIVITFHKNILTLDNGGKIEIGDDENAKYRSTRVDGKGI